MAVGLQSVACSRTTVDALLPLTLQADVGVDNANMWPAWVNVIARRCQLAL